MSAADPVVVVGAARTPIGGFQGALSPLPAPALGAAAIRGALDKAGIDGAHVDEVLMGCVLPAGVGQAPARQAAIAAGLGEAVPCTTVNKVCGSGMKAAMLAHDALLAGAVRIAVAGGMESMSNAPYLVARAKNGVNAGHRRMDDHIFLDGLKDAYDRGRLMGAFAEETAAACQLAREAQDAYALASLERARRTTADGHFADEIVPVEVGSGAAGRTIELDEGPQRADPAKIPHLRPAFREDGTITAASSSSISDGAAALVLMRHSEAERRGIRPLAAMLAHATHAQAPNRFATAPGPAIRKLLARIGWEIGDVELFEVNEAFAVVAMAAMRDLGIPHDVLNVHGGACALGHPIGTSGARIVTTLLGALSRHGLRRGVAAICIGGGEATALAVERLS